MKRQRLLYFLQGASLGLLYGTLYFEKSHRIPFVLMLLIFGLHALFVQLGLRQNISFKKLIFGLSCLHLPLILLSPSHTLFLFISLTLQIFFIHRFNKNKEYLNFQFTLVGVLLYQLVFTSINSHVSLLFLNQLSYSIILSLFILSLATYLIDIHMQEIEQPGLVKKFLPFIHFGYIVLAVIIWAKTPVMIKKEQIIVLAFYPITYFSLLLLNIMDSRGRHSTLKLWQYSFLLTTLLLAGVTVLTYS